MLGRIRPPWLGRDLSLLFAQRGLRSFSQGYLNVVVPIYLSRLGFGPIELGFLFTASAVSSAVLTAAIGVLSDRYGRKLFLILLALLTSLGGLVFSLSTSFPVLLAAAAVSTLGRGGGAGSGGAWGPYYPAEQALIAEQVSQRDRTAVFSAISFVGVLTGAVGSLAALLPAILQYLFGLSLIQGDRVLFVLTVGLGIAMALAVLPVRERVAPGSLPLRLTGRWVPLSPRTRDLLLRFSATNLTNGLAIGLLGPFLVYWFHRRYDVGAAELGVLFFVVNLATAPSYLIAARLDRLLGAVNAVVATRAISVVLLGLLALMPTYPLAAAVYLARMVAATLSVPIRQSYVMNIVDPRERASAAGLSSLPSQVAGSVSPALAGYAMHAISLSLPLELAAFLQGINTLLYYLFFRGIQPLAEQEQGSDQRQR